MEKIRIFYLNFFSFLVVKCSIYLNRREYGKYQNFLSENFTFLVVKFSIYLNRRIFVMFLGQTRWFQSYTMQKFTSLVDWQKLII